MWYQLRCTETVRRAHAIHACLHTWKSFRRKQGYLKYYLVWKHQNSTREGRESQPEARAEFRLHRLSSLFHNHPAQRADLCPSPRRKPDPLCTDTWLMHPVGTILKDIYIPAVRNAPVPPNRCSSTQRFRYQTQQINFTVQARKKKYLAAKLQ